MNDQTPAGDFTPPAPGEGERQAQRGYVPQYDLGARVIYEALAAGRLQWVGVADRGAGSFDDIVLGLRDRIAAHQVKTSRDPEPFSIRTMLLGAEDLLGRMLTSRRKLGDQHPDILIETVYACESSTNAPGVTWIRALTPNARSPMWRWPKARSAPSA